MKNRTETLEFLRSYQTQLHEARLLSEQLRELEEVVTRITPYLNQGVQVVRGPNLHKLEQSVERLEALRGELAQKLDAVAQAQARVVVAIELLEDEHANEQQIVESLYRALKAAPSKLLAASLTDAVGEHRAQNQPGTNNEYPNWRVPLADAQGNVVPLETLFDNARLQSLTAIMQS